MNAQSPTQKEVYFDVMSVMDDGAKQAWTSGRWKGKVTMHTFVPWLQAKAAELGRSVSAEEIDEFVASSKDTDLDVPLTREEIKERFKGKKKLSDIPRTRLLDQWLYQQKLGGHPAQQDDRMKEEAIRLAESLGKQIVLQQGKNIFSKIEESIKLEAYGPDGNEVACTFESCDCHQYQPTMKTQVRNCRVLVHDDGPLKGLPKRIGNFTAMISGDGRSYEVRAFCWKHVKDVAQIGLWMCPHEDAAWIAEIGNRDLELEAFGPDITIPNYSEDVTFPCSDKGCEHQHGPMMKTSVENGQVLVHDDGPLKGLPKRTGGFASMSGKDGNFEIRFFCEEHAANAMQDGIETYPYEDAEKIAEAANQDLTELKDREQKRLAGLEALRRLHGKSPAATAKAKNQGVREMRDGARASKRR